MIDTMTMTKTAAALCGALLVFMLGKWVADETYHVGEKGHGYDDHHEQAYYIEVEGDDHGGDEVEEEEAVPFAEIFAVADAGAGERAFRACQSCHKVEDGANGTGPHLYGIVGRAVGAVDGFNYSGNMVKVAQTWGPDELNLFLEDPKGYAPGTKMSYNGMRDIEDRANLIAWLDSLDN
ncbi:MAG: cytochrome c family protein [Pseudomonadota bacterium]